MLPSGRPTFGPQGLALRALGPVIERVHGHDLWPPMQPEALRLLIREKLQDGRLPRESAPRVRGSTGDGATSDACGEVITANQVMMKVGLYTGAKKSWCFHADCFMLWNTERGQL